MVTSSYVRSLFIHCDTKFVRRFAIVVGIHFVAFFLSELQFKKYIYIYILIFYTSIISDSDNDSNDSTVSGKKLN